MDAAQRLAYLDAMGVPVWLPRVELGVDHSASRLVMAPRVGDLQILPQSIIAQEKNLPDQTDQVSVDIENTASPILGEDNLPPETSKAFDAPEDANEVVADTQQCTEASINLSEVNTVDDTEVKFTVIIKYHSSALALVDVCQHPLGHQQAHHELATAILQALCAQEALATNEFSWPVANIPRLDRRLSHARISMKAFLQAFEQRNPIKTLLCFGDNLPVIDDSSVNIIRFNFSLTDVLQGKCSKREVWQKLREFSVR